MPGLVRLWSVVSVLGMGKVCVSGASGGPWCGGEVLSSLAHISTLPPTHTMVQVLLDFCLSIASEIVQIVGWL